MRSISSIKGTSQLLCAMLVTVAHAGNPLVPDVGMADPHIHIFGGKPYLYSTRDRDRNPKKGDHPMPDWTIWSSDDLIDWKRERVITPEETYIGPSEKCWAPDAASRNGKYYFYFSNGNKDAGVMVGDSPAGPFVDALGKPLLPSDLTTTKEYDITLITDEQDRPYIAFGYNREGTSARSYQIARLNEDMVSLAEAPRKIVINGDFQSDDKPTLHKRNGTYYLSAGDSFAMSQNVYGPYTSRGRSGNGKFGLDPKAHGTYFEWNNQWFHVWCYYTDGKRKAKYRDSLITYLHYKDNGDMVDDGGFLDAHFATGVGQYDALWNRIEAEWYMASEGIEKRDGPNKGFEIRNTKNGSWLSYPNLNNLKAGATVTFHAVSSAGGTIEIREGTSTGTLLGTCNIPGTGKWDQYSESSCTLKNREGKKDIVLVFGGKGSDIIHLDWFRIKGDD